MITAPDFHNAMKLLQDAEVNMPKTFGGLGKARSSEESNVVINYVKALGTTTRRMVLQKFFRDIDAQTLSNIEVLMQQMGVVKITLKPELADKIYTWIGERNE